MNLDGKRVLVCGLGISGAAAARALLARGARVSVVDDSDSEPVRRTAAELQRAGAGVFVGEHPPISGFDLAILSPGISPDASIVSELGAAGVEAWSEIELAYLLASCDFLAVTGTNGKTTTTSLLASMLAEAGVEALAAGNIGTPLIDAISRVGTGGAVVVEVSSFQLATIRSFRPVVAVILNIAEDHTDWHGSFDAYAAAKGRITENQGPEDKLVYNADDEVVSALAATATATTIPFSTLSAPPEGVGISGGAVVARGERVMDVDEIPLPGRPGLEDVCGAAAAAMAYGVDRASIERAVRSFRPLPHRLQTIAVTDQMMFIDDSKATNPHAARAAVRELTDVVLIAGGRSKGIDLEVMADMVPPVVAVVAIGESAAEIERVFSGLVPVERAASMQSAVESAVKRSVPGGSVLLSPGCASLDMYESYAARGEDFARAVRALLASDLETEWQGR
ncbi:MAG: UDP-N-acetylmuramoylalanine--D-glutamate ligase [Actinomycetota bacterium]|nr:UDP-N-acetylmuramoylalanine--D-glutamate ligase [Actinomycetota bacterium]